jgi:hypothetical protein
LSHSFWQWKLQFSYNTNKLNCSFCQILLWLISQILIQKFIITV